jgi:hypothetical protein
LDIGFFTGKEAIVLDLDGSFGHWTLDKWILKEKRKLIDTGF